MSTVAGVGVGIGVVLVLLFAFFVWLVLRRKRRNEVHIEEIEIPSQPQISVPAVRYHRHDVSSSFLTLSGQSLLYFLVSMF